MNKAEALAEAIKSISNAIVREPSYVTKQALSDTLDRLADELIKDKSDELIKDKSDELAPDEVRFRFMRDNHTFVRLYGTDLEEIISNAVRCLEKDAYGMLCPVTFLKDGKYLRKVGRDVFKAKNGPLWDRIQFDAWRTSVENDPDIARLLPTNGSSLDSTEFMSSIYP